MRVPDKNNYEIWIVDWLDGNLTETEEAVLLAFLEKNPDLKDESGLVIPDRLISSGATMNGKDILKKTAVDMDLSQIDLLSVAHLENDITSEQSAELRQCIEENNVAAERFSLIQKLKLKPSDIAYRNKKSLKKTGVPVRILRIAAITAAAAAIISFMVFFPSTVAEPDVQDTRLAENRETPIDTPEISQETRAVPLNVTDNKEIAAEKTVAAIPAGISEPPVEEISLLKPDIVSTVQEAGEEIIVVTTENYTIYQYGITPVSVVYSGQLAESFKAAGSGDPRQIKVTGAGGEDYPYDERNPVEKFIARRFREKVLNEENPTNDPIKGYEYAEVWIATLNKLWETEMALTKNKDEDGEVESVYFTAGLIKLNAKVKNNEDDL